MSESQNTAHPRPETPAEIEPRDPEAYPTYKPRPVSLPRRLSYELVEDPTPEIA